MDVSKQIYNEVGDSIGAVEYVDHMGSDQRIIDAARVSYAYNPETSEWTGALAEKVLSKKELEERRWRSEKDPKLLRYLIKNQHWSPLEHCTITWHIVVPLFARSQWHRHRTWAYSEISRRYTSEDLSFYLPDHFRPQAPKNKQASKWDEPINPMIKFYALDHEPLVPASEVVEKMSMECLRVYHLLLNAGICREQARMVLPQNMYARYYGTVNLRNALAFIQLREDNHAQWEIYKAAEVMRYHLSHLFPETLKAWDEIKGGE